MIHVIKMFQTEVKVTVMFTGELKGKENDTLRSFAYNRLYFLPFF